MGTILSLKDIVKVYPNGVIANKGVSLDIEEGIIHAIVGENGAGKTTLMKIVFGLEEAQEGQIYFKGKKIKIKNPYDAIKNGIGMVHQHFMLAPDLTVYENLLLGIEPKRGIFLNTKKAIEITKKISNDYGLPVPYDKKIKDLPIGLRQRVEILKALIRNAELLILDEPTSVLTPQESEVLFNTLRNLKKSGKTIIFISHKLKEVLEIADKVTVMRDGKIVVTKNAEDLSEHEIAYLMVGREISFERIPPNNKEGEVILEAKNISFVNEDNIKVLKDVSFKLKSYEILGLCGVEGNGQTELVEILTGLRKASTGKIFLKDKEITNLLPREIREKRVSHIPEDRMKNGVAERATLEENIIVDRYYKNSFSGRLLLKEKEIENHTNELIQKFNIVTLSSKNPVSSLSGGNIQKVVVARELSSDPLIIIADQPTRGIDVGSEELVHNLLKDARDSGAGIFLVSADLDEILKLSTRILVIYNGEIVKEFINYEGLTGKELGPYMLGLKKENEDG